MTHTSSGLRTAQRFQLPVPAAANGSTATRTPTVEIVIPVYNEERALPGCIRTLHARLRDAVRLVITTDGAGGYLDWGTPHPRRLERTTPDELDALGLAEGSMGPKVQAAARFARETGHRAVIGSLDDLAAMVGGRAGTVVERG